MNSLEHLVGPDRATQYRREGWWTEPFVHRALPAPNSPLNRYLDIDRDALFGESVSLYGVVKNGTGSLQLASAEQARVFFSEDYTVRTTLTTLEPWLETLRQAMGVGRATEFLMSAFISPRARESAMHCDPSMFFVVQLTGTKEWRLAPNLWLPAPRGSVVVGAGKAPPRGALPMGELPTEMPENCTHITLQPGDCLYVPWGWWHQPKAVTDSIHLTVIPMWQTTYADIALDAVRFALSRDPSWQRPAPPMNLNRELIQLAQATLGDLVRRSGLGVPEVGVDAVHLHRLISSGVVSAPEKQHARRFEISVDASLVLPPPPDFSLSRWCDVVSEPLLGTRANVGEMKSNSVLDCGPAWALLIVSGTENVPLVGSSVEVVLEDVFGNSLEKQASIVAVTDRRATCDAYLVQVSFGSAVEPADLEMLTPFRALTQDDSRARVGVASGTELVFVDSADHHFLAVCSWLKRREESSATRTFSAQTLIEELPQISPAEHLNFLKTLEQSGYVRSA